VAERQEGCLMNDVLSWFGDAQHWSGQDGVPTRLLEHLTYSALALVIAALIAIPLGLYVGHSGRGRLLVVGLAGAGRAIPSLGLLFVAVLFFGPRLAGDAAFFVPCQIVLVVLAVPPILNSTYAGVDAVDPQARDSAKGMGMRGAEVLLKVELPCALPLMLSGLRSGALQIVATATIAATAGLGGLGRFLIDGLSLRDYSQMAAGAFLVAALALSIELVFAILGRLVVSPGLRKTRRTRRVRNTARTLQAATTASTEA
jgi:osmoprotectant transport system permease protein